MVRMQKPACRFCSTYLLTEIWRDAARALALGKVPTELREDLYKREREARQAGDREEAEAYNRVRRDLG